MAGSPELETGNGPSSPGGDNLPNDFVQESAASHAGFGAARGDRIGRVDGIVTLVDAGSPLPFINRAIVEAPIDDVRTVLDHIRPFYDDGPRTPFLLDSAWPTPDLTPVDRTAYNYEHALIYGYPAPQLQPMTEVSVVTREALAAPGWQHFVGYVDDEAVASASAYVGDRLVRVDNIATLHTARGRGYGLAMTAAAAAVDPTKPATLIASDLGRGVYERLGFIAMLRFTYRLGLRSQ